MRPALPARCPPRVALRALLPRVAPRALLPARCSPHSSSQAPHPPLLTPHPSPCDAGSKEGCLAAAPRERKGMATGPQGKGKATKQPRCPPVRRAGQTEHFCLCCAFWFSGVGPENGSRRPKIEAIKTHFLLLPASEVVHGAFAKEVCAQALSRVFRTQAHVDGRIYRLGRGERLNTTLTMN